MRKKKIKPIKKKMFFFEVPIYEREICVVVGMTHEEAMNEAKRQKCTKDFLEALNWETAKEHLNDVFGDTNVMGSACRVNEDRYFLFLKPYRNDWQYLDILNHEIFHITQFICEPLKIWNDVEPPAYLHGWLFKKIRGVLSGYEK